MSLNFPVLKIRRKASGAVAAYRLCKAGADGVVAQASAATDKLQGVSGELAAADGEGVELNVIGIVPVEYGGNVTNGDKLTSDGNGKAVVAAAGQEVMGFAFEDGDDGTIGSILLARSEADSTV